MPRSTTTRGTAYLSLGEYQRATEDLNEALRLVPQFATAYVNRAVSYTLLGMDAEAQEDIERAIELGFDRGVVESAIAEAKRNR